MENQPQERRGRHAVWDMHVRLVFVTRYRAEVFTSELLGVCESSMRKVCADFGCELEEFNGEQDHVHLLVKFPATVEIAKLVNSLKGVSSRLMRKEFPDRVNKYLWSGKFWSRSYYAGSTGGAGIDTIRNYIEEQNSPK